MKVILLRDVKNSGKQGTIIEVAEGYARNFLIPQKLADFASESLIEAFQKKVEADEVNKEAEKKLASKLVKKLAKHVLQFEMPGDDKGKLYAGLKESEILSRIKESNPGIKYLKLVDYVAIKAAGNHLVRIRLGEGADQETEITVCVSKK